MVNNGDCIHEAKFAELETRLAKVEKEQERESSFRAEFYNYQREQIDHEARMDERMKSMDEKLDTLVEWQTEQQKKPGKRFDGIVDKLIWAVLGAVATLALKQMGILL